MNSISEPKPAVQRVGTIDVALAHAKRLLADRPELAAEQALEILKIHPHLASARLILGTAHRRAGRAPAALEVLEPLAVEQPGSVPVHLELGVARGEAGRVHDAVAALRRAVALKPDSTDGWRLLADMLEADGDRDGADQARARHLKAATRDPRLMSAAAALVDNDLPVADAHLRRHLAAHPSDVAALRMLAEVAGRLRKYRDAEEILRRCLQLAPGFDAARHNYAVVLDRQMKSAAALQEVERLLAKEPRNTGYLNLKAAILAHLGHYGAAIEAYAEVLRDHPRHSKVWLSYGHALRTVGRADDAIAAYHRAIELEPTLGEAYWSLANLKTFRFSSADIEALRAALGRSDLSVEDRLHFEFALGKALEDDGAYEESFACYARGNATRLRQHPYRADENTRFVERAMQLFTKEFFEARAGAGADAPDAIFIVGLPRAGSTLLEQILASHSQVEGTIELPDMPRIARELADNAGDAEGASRFFDAIAALSREELRRLGEEYLATTRVHRKTGAPFFIDKMPNNCLYVGLIRILLPNAKIIDARRHPLGCCLSAYKQHFSRGQSFTYDLADVGRYYRDYVRLMAHFDAVLPGYVHRVFHERVIDDTENEVQRLLAYCGLPFEPACLRFYENERPVRTPSSEQVRQPIFKEGKDHWRHFEPQLAPLKEALGAVLERYPDVPQGVDAA